MVSFEYVIKDVHGIHARPATDLFKMTKNYQSVVKVAKGDKEVPFKDHPSGCICDLTGTEYKICTKCMAMCYYV